MNKTSGGSTLTVDLLQPEEGNQFRVINLKLIEGNEAGITVSNDSLQLEIDAAAYNDQSSPLSYRYQLVSSEGPVLDRTLSFLVDASSSPATISGLSISTDEPESHQLAPELLQVNLDNNPQHSTTLTTEKPESKELPATVEAAFAETAATNKLSEDELQPVTESGELELTISNSTPILFTDSDFKFKTPPSSFELVITSQPESGQLLFNNHRLSSEQTITRSDLLTGRLKYVPEPDQPFPFSALFSYQASIQPEAIDSSPSENSVTRLIEQKPMLEGIYLAYSFNTGAGLQVIDESGHDNHASLTGNASWMTCRKHSSSTFAMDGSEGGAEIENLKTGGAMTIAAWVRFNDFEQPWSRILDFGNGPADNNIILSHQANSNGLSFRVYSGDSNQSSSLEINDFFRQEEWLHVTATVDDSGLMTIYRNGILLKSREGIVPAKCHRQGNFLGKSHWAGDGYLSGNIDDLLIINHCLDEQAVMAVYLADTVDTVMSPCFYTDSLTPDKLIGTVQPSTADHNTTFSITDDTEGYFRIDHQTGAIYSTEADTEIRSVYTFNVQAVSESVSDTVTVTVLVTAQPGQTPSKKAEVVEQSSFSAPPLSLEFLAKLVQRDESLSQSIIIEDLPEGCELEDDFERIKTDGHPVNITAWNLNQLTLTPAESTPEHFTASVVINNLDKKNREPKEPELITLDINWPEQTASILNIGPAE